MKCWHCGTLNPKDADYCFNCGHQIHWVRPDGGSGDTFLGGGILLLGFLGAMGFVAFLAWLYGAL